jgi:formylglycine-generating enzyme required for sulfatase activity
VEVASLYVCRYEVWVAEWQKVRAWALQNGYQINLGLNFIGGHPIRGVSWYDAVKWCNAKSEMDGREPVYYLDGAVFRTGEIPPFSGSPWMMSQPERLNVTRNQTASGYRLPTTAEWEWAARGGVLTQNYTYSGSNNLDDVAWHYGNSIGSEMMGGGPVGMRGTWPVGTKVANELGLYDMSGNAWEWCEDLIVRELYWVPGGSLTYLRALRGGSFDSFDSNQYQYSGWQEYEYGLRWTLREANETSTLTSNQTGFRIVYNAVQTNL